MNLIDIRRFEMGTRAALGASSAKLIRLVVGSGMRLAGAGLVFRCIAGLVAARLLRAFLFGVSTTDPVTVAVTISVLASAAAVASFLPARRAGRVNPIEALRAE
jgi:putative ABC transport system permease protein